MCGLPWHCSPVSLSPMCARSSFCLEHCLPKFPHVLRNKFLLCLDNISQYSPVCSDQPIPDTAGEKVPSYKVPQKYLNSLYPKLPRQKPPDHVHLLWGRHEGTDCQCSTVWWHELIGRWWVWVVHVKSSVALCCNLDSYKNNTGRLLLLAELQKLSQLI